jgi:hypothetical protein
MSSAKKLQSKPVKRYTFSHEEIQRLKCRLELKIAHEEIIGLLDGYSACFADWSVCISASVHDSIAKKQMLNMDCEKERKMLENLSFLFTKLAYHSGTLSDWHKQLTLGNELTEKMIADGHP